MNRLVIWFSLIAAAAQAADHTAIFTAPPHYVPTRGMPDGPLLGNGDVGVVLGGPPEAQTFYIGKNDFWRRNNASVIAVGQVKLSVQALRGAVYRQEQDMGRAEARGTFSKDGLTVRTRSWVDANENLLVTQVQCEGAPVSFSVLQSAGGSAAAPEIDERLATSFFARKADSLPGRSREVAVATRILGAEVRADGEGGLSFTLKPGETATVASAVLSDLDADNFASSAKRRVAALTPKGLEVLSARHQKWWAEFWSRSFVEIPDKEIEKRWYAALYVMGSCSRAGKTAPGLWGNWVTTEDPNWHGDFHLNYNFQAAFYMVYSANHADLSLPFYQAVSEAVPAGREIARKHGWNGVHFPVSIGPRGLLPEGPDSDWGQRSDAAFAALNFIWYYQYTQDTGFLRATAYPYLREVADFWENYLKFENGRYVIYNDSIHEGSGPDFNPLLSLGLARTLFKNMLVMSQALGEDAGKRAKWQDILDKLSAFPLQERGGKTVFRYSEKGMAWNDGNTLGIHHIFPAGAIGLDSDPKLLEISRNMINVMGRWNDYNGFSSWFTACARVGYDPKVILTKLRAECDQHSFPNLLLYYGGGGIESCGGFLAINEMLFQSHEGVLRFFPCWPKDQDARFGGLRAAGAFLVSAELKNGVVTGVRILSEKGRPCTVLNPWSGSAVSVIRNGKPAEVVTGGPAIQTVGEGFVIPRRRGDFGAVGT